MSTTTTDEKTALINCTGHPIPPQAAQAWNLEFEFNKRMYKNLQNTSYIPLFEKYNSKFKTCQTGFEMALESN